MNDNEIKAANRKAMPRFLLLMAVSMLVGGALGYVSARYGLSALSGGIKSAGEFFGAHVAHWLMLAAAIAVPAPVFVVNRCDFFLNRCIFVFFLHLLQMIVESCTGQLSD